MNIKTMNREGLTLIEWLLAAGIEDVKAVCEAHIAAWKAGEDPSEHRAREELVDPETDELSVSVTCDANGETVTLAGDSVANLAEQYHERFRFSRDQGAGTVYDTHGFVKGWVHADGSWRAS